MKQNLEKVIADFKSETGYELEIRDGRPYYSGDLDLDDVTGITSLPNGLTVGGYLYLQGTGITSLPNGLTVGGPLYLEDCTGITSLLEGLTVGGSIYLSGTSITLLPDGLTVGCDLDLKDCTGITSLPDDLTVGGYLDLRGTGITSLPEGMTVGGSIDMRGTGITSLPEGMTVGGSIDMRGTGITSLLEGMTVGGSIYLEDCTGITSLPEGLTVGGDLDLNGTGITDAPNAPYTLSAESRKKINDAQNRPITWKRNGREYIKVDGMFTVIDSHHGNVYRVHKLGSEEQLYLVTDGDNHWAHGDTLQEARTDLVYKINDRDTSMYKGMTLDDTLTFEEAIAAYRTITGACSPGTRDYITNRLPKPHKEKYTIREIITLTEGEYGSEKFKEFFCKRNERNQN